MSRPPPPVFVTAPGAAFAVYQYVHQTAGHVEYAKAHGRPARVVKSDGRPGVEGIRIGIKKAGLCFRNFGSNRTCITALDRIDP